MVDKSKGTLYIVSAPSGAGKTSLLKELLKKEDLEVELSVSHTTRARREGETHGQEYYFVSIDEFQTMVQHDDFLEHAQVFDNYYGTSKSGVLKKIDLGIDVVLEIDWQGARQVREAIPDAVSVYILPPSVEELENRLRGRGQDSDETIQRRMRDAFSEISHYNEYDYVIINDQFEVALEELRIVMLAQRLRLDRQLEKLDVLLSGIK
ncbi:MAG: guanylate kinase [Gammaproteobacteria bacterium]|nr:MAG: guanylate kinase [Gammaproteobacteria bacterium]